MDGTFLSEAHWPDLLREIHNHQLIPIVGPEMVTKIPGVGEYRRLEGCLLRYLSNELFYAA
jgi:hypothetical protein